MRYLLTRTGSHGGVSFVSLKNTSLTLSKRPRKVPGFEYPELQATAHATYGDMGSNETGTEILKRTEDSQLLRGQLGGAT